MGNYKQLDEIDKDIIDILSHYDRLDFIDLWYELREGGDTEEHISTKHELLRRLELLASKGFVKSKGDVWIFTK